MPPSTDSDVDDTGRRESQRPLDAKKPAWLDDLLTTVHRDYADLHASLLRHPDEAEHEHTAFLAAVDAATAAPASATAQLAHRSRALLAAAETLCGAHAAAARAVQTRVDDAVAGGERRRGEWAADRERTSPHAQTDVTTTMGTRSFAQVEPTAATMALNASIFGYSGHSLVTPHAPLQQLWWTDARIDRVVTRAFIVARLRHSPERAFLHRPLVFGDALTDCTYLDWILDRARRLFLILADIGRPEHIFHCVNDVWADDDLPLAPHQLPRLELSWHGADRDLDARFYRAQFVYLLRQLRPGDHIDYAPREHIPMESVPSLPPAVHLQAWDRVHFPGRPRDVYMRRKFPFAEPTGAGAGAAAGAIAVAHRRATTAEHRRDAFMRDVDVARAHAHPHIVPVWATYISDDAGYVLSDFVGEHTLGTFIDHRTPRQFSRLPHAERPRLLLRWMLCLASAVAALHRDGIVHGAVRPSNILVDADNHIAFADIGSLRTFQRGKRATRSEAYDYAAPESAPLSPATTTSRRRHRPPISSVGPFQRLRKLSSSTSSSSTGSTSTIRDPRSTVDDGGPSTPPSPQLLHSRSPSSVSTVRTILSPPPSPWRSDFSIGRTPSLPFTSTSPLLSPATTAPVSPSATAPSSPRSSSFPQATAHDPAPDQSADIFSLACIYLDLLTFLLRGKTTEFTKFRATAAVKSAPSSPSHSSFPSVAIPYTAVRSAAAPITSTPVPVVVATSPRRRDKDHSFHAHPQRLDAWMRLLHADVRVAFTCCGPSDNATAAAADAGPGASWGHDGPALLRRVDALWPLLRAMLSLDPAARPTADEVWEFLRDVGVGVAGTDDDTNNPDASVFGGGMWWRGGCAGCGAGGGSGRGTSDNGDGGPISPTNTTAGAPPSAATRTPKVAAMGVGVPLPTKGKTRSGRGWRAFWRSGTT